MTGVDWSGVEWSGECKNDNFETEKIAFFLANFRSLKSTGPPTRGTQRNAERSGRGGRPSTQVIYYLKNLDNATNPVFRSAQGIPHV